ARKPRTECGCQPVKCTIAAIVAPLFDRSIARTRACLVAPPRERRVCDVIRLLDLRFFSDFERIWDLVGDFAIGTSETGDAIRRTTSTPQRPVTRGVRSPDATSAPKQ